MEFDPTELLPDGDVGSEWFSCLTSVIGDLGSRHGVEDRDLDLVLSQMDFRNLRGDFVADSHPSSFTKLVGDRPSVPREVAVQTSFPDLDLVDSTTDLK